MKTEIRVIFSLLLLFLLGITIYKVSFIIAPFAIALILSYFLHPAISYFEERGVARFVAVIFVMAIFFASFISLMIWMIPILYEQIVLLVKTVPFYLKIYHTNFYPKLMEAAASYSLPIDLKADNIFDPKMATSFVKSLSLKIFHSSSSLINFFSFVFIVPILVFYLLKDWRPLKEGFFASIPSSVYKKVSTLLKDIDRSLSGYMRGQAVVCLIMAAIYSILFLVVGLDFSLLIGTLTGIFTFIPYIGALTGFVAAVAIALFQWGFSVVDISLVVGAFFIGQFIESNFLTPRLIGDRVGLHPVWIIFGIFAFGALFGFVGVLLATPLTAVVGVLIKDLALEYKKRYIKK